MSSHSPLTTLVEAVQQWAADREGSPAHPADAHLLKALWTYEGDRTKPCDECDGDCGEPCAPCTVAQAHAWLDRWVAEYPEQQAKREKDRAAFVRLAVSVERERCAKSLEDHAAKFEHASPTHGESFAADILRASAAAIRAGAGDAT